MSNSLKSQSIKCLIFAHLLIFSTSILAKKGGGVDGGGGGNTVVCDDRLRVLDSVIMAGENSKEFKSHDEVGEVV